LLVGASFVTLTANPFVLIDCSHERAVGGDEIVGCGNHCGNP